MIKITFKRIFKTIIFILIIFHYYVENILTGKFPPNYSKDVESLKVLKK